MGKTLSRTRMVAQGKAFAVLTFEQFVILWWRTNVVLEGVKAANSAFQLLSAEFPGRKLGFLTLIDPGCEVLVPRHVREAISKLVEANDTKIGAAIVVYDPPGFQATIVRSGITAINLAVGSSFPNKVLASIGDGAEWLGAQMRAHCPRVSSADIRATIAELQAQRS